MPHSTGSQRGVVILGVAESDAHAVANQLIAMYLRTSGFEVVNLGTCTPLTCFAEAFEARPEALAVAIGSLNGHAYQDLRRLPELRAAGRLGCPLIVGGNLCVGQHKGGQDERRLRALGVDHVLNDINMLVLLLDTLAVARIPVLVHD